MFRYSLRRLHLRLRNIGVAVIEHPVRSFGWTFPEAIELNNSNGFFSPCFGIAASEERGRNVQLFYTTVPTFIGHFINQPVGVMTS